MVAYSFKRRFAVPIRSKLKRHTIRADRKRHARPGEELQLYTGMRTTKCELIGRATCTAILGVRLDFRFRRVEFDSGHAVTTPEDTDSFAVADGFTDWRDMEAFWRVEHPDGSEFSGVMIQWGETFRMPEGMLLPV